jgi:hypothetical protein
VNEQHAGERLSMSVNKNFAFLAQRIPIRLQSPISLASITHYSDYLHIMALRHYQQERSG